MKVIQWIQRRFRSFLTSFEKLIRQATVYIWNICIDMNHIIIHPSLGFKAMHYIISSSVLSLSEFQSYEIWGFVHECFILKIPLQRKQHQRWFWYFNTGNGRTPFPTQTLFYYTLFTFKQYIREHIPLPKKNLKFHYFQRACFHFSFKYARLAHSSQTQKERHLAC